MEVFHRFNFYTHSFLHIYFRNCVSSWDTAMVATGAAFWDISKLSQLSCLVVAPQKGCQLSFTERETGGLSFRTWARRSSSFLKQVCHVRPNNLWCIDRQIRPLFHSIFKPIYAQTTAEMRDLTLPWHPRRCGCSQLCTGACTQAWGRAKKWSGWKWLCFFFCWVFRGSSCPDLTCVRMYKW